MTAQTPSHLFKFLVFFVLFSLLFLQSAKAQGISEMGGAYAGSAKLIPTKSSADSLSRTFKPVGQSTPSGSSSSNTGALQEITVACKEAIKEANKDCLLAQEKEKAGKLLEAQKLYAKALAIRRRYWGTKDLAQATILYKIAEFHQRLGNPASAEICLKEALKVQARHIAPGSFEVVPILEQLAKLSMSQKKFEEAETYYERILTLQERRNGTDARQSFAARLNLIDAAISLKDYKEARIYLDRCQETYTRLKDQPDHKIQDEQKNDYVSLLDRYVTAMQALNKSEEAQPYVVRANTLRPAK